MLVSVRALVADPITSQGGSLIQLSPSVGEVAPSMRVITQDEFDGKVPIIIKLNQTLAIPIHYERVILCNNISIFAAPEDSSTVSVAMGGDVMSPDAKEFDCNLFCTGMKAGQTTVNFGEEATIIKKIVIQVVE